MRTLFTFLLFCFFGSITYGQTLTKQKKSTTELSKENIKNNEDRKKNSPGPDEISKSDPNYKDLKAPMKCVAIKSNGKRCNYRAKKGTTYCVWHNKNNNGY